MPIQREVPAGHVVQQLLGQAVVDAIRDFASADIPDIETLERETFGHVRDRVLRRSLADTFFGARWLYRLGLVTLATDVHRAAHVRAQVIDYAAICEAALGDAIGHGIFRGGLAGTEWTLDTRGNQVGSWPKTRTAIALEVRKHRNFRWLIDVAAEEKMVPSGLRNDLHWLRDRRNAVHIAELAALDERVGIGTSRKAYGLMQTCVKSAGAWVLLRP